jgi:hypothetical protein
LCICLNANKIIARTYEIKKIPNEEITVGLLLTFKEVALNLSEFNVVLNL